MIYYVKALFCNGGGGMGHNAQTENGQNSIFDLIGLLKNLCDDNFK